MNELQATPEVSYMLVPGLKRDEPPSPSEIPKIIHEILGYDPTKRTRKTEYVLARTVATMILYRHYNLSLNQIGGLLCGYHHASVINNIRRIRNYIENNAHDPELGAAIDRTYAGIIKLPPPVFRKKRTNNHDGTYTIIFEQL